MSRTIKEKYIGGDCSGGGKYFLGLDGGGRFISTGSRNRSFCIESGPAIGGGGGGDMGGGNGTNSGGG